MPLVSLGNDVRALALWSVGRGVLLRHGTDVASSQPSIWPAWTNHPQPGGVSDITTAITARAIVPLSTGETRRAASHRRVSHRRYLRRLVPQRTNLQQAAIFYVKKHLAPTGCGGHRVEVPAAGSSTAAGSTRSTSSSRAGTAAIACGDLGRGRGLVAAGPGSSGSTR